MQPLSAEDSKAATAFIDASRRPLQLGDYFVRENDLETDYGSEVEVIYGFC